MRRSLPWGIATVLGTLGLILLAVRDDPARGLSPREVPAGTVASASGTTTDAAPARPASREPPRETSRSSTADAGDAEDDPLASLPPDLAERFAEANALRDGYQHERAAQIYLAVLRDVDDPAALHPELWLAAAFNALHWRNHESATQVTTSDRPAEYARALEALASSRLSSDLPGLAPVKLAHAIFEADAGRLAAAEALATEALDARFTDGGQMLRLTRLGFGFLTMSFDRASDRAAAGAESAARLLERALENHARLPPDPERDATFWASQLEDAYRSLGDDVAAERVIAEWGLEGTLREAQESRFDPDRLEARLAELERERPPDDEDVLDTLDDIALVRAGAGRTREALEVRREILGRLEASGAGGARLSGALAEVAVLEAEQSRLLEAERLYERAIEAALPDVEARDQELAQRSALAKLREGQGRSGDAAPHVERLEEAVAAGMERWGPSTDPMIYASEAGLALELAEIHVLGGRTEEAEALLRRVLEVNPEGEWPTLMGRFAEISLADLLWKDGRAEEARSLYRSAVDGGWLTDAEQWVTFSREMGDEGSAAEQQAEIDRVRTRLESAEPSPSHSDLQADAHVSSAP